MSGPSFENIDRWLFEYVEGNLTNEQIHQLEAFMLDHPEFDLDLDSWQMTKVEPVLHEFPNQEALYREEKKRRRALPYVFGFSSLTTLLILSFFLLTKSNRLESGESFIGLAHEAHIGSKNLGLTKKGFSNSNPHASKSAVSPNYLARRFNNFTPVTTPVLLTQSSSSILSSNSSKVEHSLNTRPDLPIALSNGLGQFNSNDSANFPSNNDIEQVAIDPTSINSLDSVSDNVETKANSKQSLIQDSKKKMDSKKKSFGKSANSKFTLKKILANLNNYMGNEIGLKNTRDHQIHVPGLSQLDINFSSAGDISSTRFRTLSRAQWVGQENHSFSNQMSLDWFTKSLKSGFGIQGNYQLYGNGVIQNWNAAFVYSPKLLLSKSFLIEPGIRLKMGSKILNGNLVNNTDKVEVERDNLLDFYTDGSVPIGRNQWFRDLGTSLLIHSKWFYIGAQADNLLRHQDNIYSNSISSPRRASIYYSVNFGTEYESKSGDLSFSPYGYYEKFENREEAWGGFNFQYKAWQFGGALSNKSNFAVSTGLRFSTFALTYQFDQTYSNLLGSSASSHQLSIMFNTKVSRSSRRYIHLK
jgi:hypothetical protein